VPAAAAKQLVYIQNKWCERSRGSLGVNSEIEL
jgi:hypothetical protein